MARLVYHPGYDISFFGIERLHPFDSKKYGRAWALLRERFGEALERETLRPSGPVTSDELLAVHSVEYLKELCHASYVAQVLELPAIALFPMGLVDSHILKPMRLATAGTILAATEAMSSGFTANLSGGYHHAKPDSGEGFCPYADAALALHHLRGTGALAEEDGVVYIDLDAHLGNGFSHAVMEDRRVYIFDMYNEDVFPNDLAAERRAEWDLPLKSGSDDAIYLQILRTQLPGFLDDMARVRPLRLAIFNAGTDVFRDDPLGHLALSSEAVLDRDTFVISELKKRGIPTLMLPSGGYTQESHRLLYRTLERVLSTIHPLT